MNPRPFSLHSWRAIDTWVVESICWICGPSQLYINFQPLYWYNDYLHHSTITNLKISYFIHLDSCAHCWTSILRAHSPHYKHFILVYDLNHNLYCIPLDCWGPIKKSGHKSPLALDDVFSKFRNVSCALSTPW